MQDLSRNQAQQFSKFSELNNSASSIESANAALAMLSITDSASVTGKKCALKTYKNALNPTRAIAAARAQHIELTRAPETLTTLFVHTLDLRSIHARFAVHFLRALDLKSACKAAGIGYETGRTYLKILFEVTGSGSQVELVVVLGWVARYQRSSIERLI